MLNPMELAESVIPDLIRNPVVQPWTPAFAGMTWFSLFFGVTDYWGHADLVSTLDVNSSFRRTPESMRRNERSPAPEKSPKPWSP